MSITKSHKSGLKQSYAAAIVLNRALLSLREYRTVSWRAWRNTVRFSTAGRNRRAFCGLFSPRGDGRGSGPEVPCYASGYSCAFGARRPSGKGLATAGYIRDGMCVQNRGVSPQAPPEACRKTPRLPNRHGKPVESARVRRLCQINCRHLAEMVVWRADDGGLAVETIVTGTAFSAVRCSSGRK